MASADSLPMVSLGSKPHLNLQPGSRDLGILAEEAGRPSYFTKLSKARK